MNSIRITGTSKLFINHFKALSIKRIRYFKRDYKGFVCEIILPCIIVIFGLLVAQGSTVVESPYNTFTPKTWSEKPDVWYGGYHVNSSKEEMKSVLAEIKTEFNFHYISTSGSSQEQ